MKKSQNLANVTRIEGMNRIVFESTTTKFTILNPFSDFAPEEHCVEVRKDPLLGDTSIYNPFLKDKARIFFSENDALLVRDLAEETAKTCIFCGENVLQKTARYPEELIREGRIRAGEACLFANTFSVGKYHPVIALSKAHFLRLSEFTAGMLADGFNAAQQFLMAVRNKDASVAFATINANYLLPAGASLMHPHLQMLITPLPYSYHARMLTAVRAYHSAYGSSYFDDLASEEKKSGGRYIGQRGNWHWIAVFSPIGSNEIMAIHAREADFEVLTDGDLRDLSYGITKVLSLYERLGHLSFNFSLYSASANSSNEGFRCILKIISRQNLYPNYRNDDYFLQKMLQSELIFNLPEELAEWLREVF